MMVPGLRGPHCSADRLELLCWDVPSELSKIKERRHSFMPHPDESLDQAAPRVRTRPRGVFSAAKLNSVSSQRPHLQ